MVDTAKVLAQIAPPAAALTALYTCPALTQTAVSSIVICNQNASPTTIAFRVSIAINNAADTPSQYMYYDIPLWGNDTFIATVGLTLAANDQIRVRTDTANVSFSLYGIQVT